MPERDALLEVRDISRTTVAGSQLLASTSFQVYPGDCIACQGKTGSGKSVLLRCLSRLDECGGQIVWKGKPVTSASIPKFRSEVVYVPQQASFSQGRVRQAIQEPLTWKVNAGKLFNESDARKYFSALGQSERIMDRPMELLSGGEAQIVAVVRALVVRPTILLLDEPTSALDEATTAAFETLLKQWLAHSERAILWVTHNQQQARRIATRRFHVEKGKWTFDA